MKRLIVVFIFIIAIGLAVAPNPAQAQDQNKAPEPAPAQERPQTQAQGQTKAPPATATPGPRPKMVLPEKEYNAGLNPPGTSITHEFQVKNEGDDDLILEVVPGCGCVVTNFDKTIIPGQSGTIIVTVDLYDAWAGRAVNKAVTVSSNDPDAPLSRLIMRAKVDEKKPE